MTTDAIVSLFKDNKQITYLNFPVICNFEVPGWKTIDCRFGIDPEIIKKADRIKIYVWNFNNQVFYIDDLDLTYADKCY